MQLVLRHIPSIARVPHRSVLSVVGSQATEFLSGILPALLHTPPRPCYSAFLHAQGRILYDVFLYTRADPTGRPSYLIDFDHRPSEAPPLLDLLKRYILRSRVKVRDVSDEYDVWAVWGSPSEDETLARRWKWAEHSGVAEPEWDSAEEWPWGTRDQEIHDMRAPGMGRRVLVRKGDLPEQASSHDQVSSDAYNLHRILHGVPEGAVDLPAMQAFPMESNLDLMGGLDFRKGCYVGQELTVRTYHTGLIRKRIMPVAIHRPNSPPEIVTSSADIPSFAELNIRAVPVQSVDQDQSTPRPRGHGKLLSSTNGVGLALLRLEQVQAAEQEKIAFSMETQLEGVNTEWRVSHWRPDWWPRKDM